MLEQTQDPTPPAAPRTPARQRLEPLPALMLTIVAVAVAITALFGLRGMPIEAFSLLFLRYDPWPMAISGMVVLLAMRWMLPDASLLKILAIASRFWIIGPLVLVVLCACVWLVYQNHPLAMDEFAIYFQSRIFARGRLTGSWPVPLLGGLGFGFGTFLEASAKTGHVISAYWPGAALLLTPFTAAGIPWAWNPCLSVLSLWLIRQITRHLTGEKNAGTWAMLLTLASPTFWANGISYYSMPTHMCLNLAFAYLLLLGRPWQILLAGVIGSLALVLHNPLPHMAFALPWFLWLITGPRRWQRMSLLVLGYVPLTLLLGVGWMWLRSQIGQGVEAGSAFSAPNLTVLMYRAVGFAKIVAWEVPGLMALAIFGVLRFGSDRRVQALAASAAITFLVYFAVVHNQGHGWGYRYFQTAWGVMPVLAALTLCQAQPRAIRLPARLPQIVATLVIVSAVVLVPWRLLQIRDFVGLNLMQIPPHNPRQSTVIFINIHGGFYRQDLVQNDPFMRDKVLYIISSGKERDAQIMGYFFPTYQLATRAPAGTAWVDTSGSNVPPGQALRAQPVQRAR